MGVESKLNAENGIADPYPIPVKLSLMLSLFQNSCYYQKLTPMFRVLSCNF